MSNNTDFTGLREKLGQLGEWPLLYMFKFIVPSDNHKIALIENLFGDESDIRHMPSSKGKYTSITVRQVMLDADSVIDIYQKASAIEGVMVL